MNWTKIPKNFKRMNEQPFKWPFVPVIFRGCFRRFLAFCIATTSFWTICQNSFEVISINKAFLVNCFKNNNFRQLKLKVTFHDAREMNGCSRKSERELNEDLLNFWTNELNAVQNFLWTDERERPKSMNDLHSSTSKCSQANSSRMNSSKTSIFHLVYG